jgi:23S rRNA (cytosine1962-C5)-methyltransferase
MPEPTPLPDTPDLLLRVETALADRAALFERLHEEQTDCYRLLHGAVEGAPGLTVDRYGPLLLVQTFRAPLPEGALDALHGAAQAALGVPLLPVWNHRGGARSAKDFERFHAADEAAGAFHVGHEGGTRFAVRGRHRGLDPLHFLDFRVVRRWLGENAAGADVLNLFAYTCTAGVAAAVGGASRVVDVDFAASALDVGARNARLNGLDASTVERLQSDYFVAARQLAGLAVKGRAARRRRWMRVQPRQFDITVLDPPTFAKSPFGTVDLVRDYPSVLKPALLATRPGGTLIASNHVSTVTWEDWIRGVRRSADKAGRPIADVQRLMPELDFPSPDGRPPLKVAVLRLSKDPGARSR